MTSSARAGKAPASSPTRLSLSCLASSTPSAQASRAERCSTGWPHTHAKRTAMPSLPAELYYAEIEASTAMLAAIVDTVDDGLAIPSCPDWTLRQLATHLGRAQRWATEIVATRSQAFIEFRAVPDGKLPGDQAERGHWLTAGATRLVSALRG